MFNVALIMVIIEGLSSVAIGLSYGITLHKALFLHI